MTQDNLVTRIPEQNVQPEPTPNDSTPVWELVVADMKARDQIGRARYGVPLQAGNGRDQLRDAYEECLDMAVYLRTAIEERQHALHAHDPRAKRAALDALLTQMRKDGQGLNHDQEQLMRGMLA